MKLKILLVAFVLSSLSVLANPPKDAHMTYPSKQISIGINRNFADVYAFVSKPENMPQWAAGLSGSIKKVGDHWESTSPMGTVKVSFAEPNRFGVIDHNVTLPSGQVVYNPLRVMKNNDGSEVVFTLFKLAGVSDQDFNKDASMVEADLKKLKGLLEK